MGSEWQERVAPHRGGYGGASLSQAPRLGMSCSRKNRVGIDGNGEARATQIGNFFGPCSEPIKQVGRWFADDHRWKSKFHSLERWRGPDLPLNFFVDLRRAPRPAPGRLYPVCDAVGNHFPFRSLHCGVPR